MSALALKAAATLLTLLASAASALYVTGHVKNGAAPLHPPVLQAGADGGRLMLSPGVRASDVRPVTSTYAS